MLCEDEDFYMACHNKRAPRVPKYWGRAKNLARSTTDTD